MRILSIAVNNTQLRTVLQEFFCVIFALKLLEFYIGVVIAPLFSAILHFPSHSTPM
jgi:hypothetical protein